MMSSEFPASQKTKEAVLLLANHTEDEEAVQWAREDAEDHWIPPDGFNK